MQIHKRRIISSYFSLCTVDTNKLFRSCILLNLIAILCILHVGCVNRYNDGSINIYPYPFACIFPVTLLPGTLTLISAWISNYIHYKVWLEITYPFPHFHGFTILEWISYFTSHFTGLVILKLILISRSLWDRWRPRKLTAAYSQPQWPKPWYRLIFYYGKSKSIMNKHKLSRWLLKIVLELS